MNTDTPRTDASLLCSDCTYNCAHTFTLRGVEVAAGNEEVVVLADFARELERENTRLRNRLSILEDATT